jgi:FkbM family methyltransferase
MIRSLIRRVVPRNLRIRARQSALLRWLGSRCFGGVCSRPFPGSRYTLYFDGYRNFSSATVALEEDEKDERDFVVRLLRGRPNLVLWDVGANIGLWSLYLTALCPDAREVRCFEPDAVNLKYLRLNQERNGLANWTIRPLALSDRTGEAGFFTDGVTGATGSLESWRDFVGRHFKAPRGEIRIPLTTIDAEVAAGAPPPQFIKVDVEGHELHVLRGGVQTLREHHPALLFESTHEKEAVARLLRDLGYGLTDLRGRSVEVPNYYTVAVPPGGDCGPVAIGPALIRGDESPQTRVE